MKVLLKEDIENLGYAGEVYKVAAGYGRNFLLPQGLAEVATPTALKKADAWRSRAEARRMQLKAEYDALAEKIEAAVLTFVVKAGDTGKMYGSITNSEIADQLNAELGTELSRRSFVTEPIRMTGEHKVAVRLDIDHTPSFTVVVNREGQEQEAEEFEETVLVVNDEFDDDMDESAE